MMSCTASHSMSDHHRPVESQMEESAAQRRGSRAYQIFPEINRDEECTSYSEDFFYRRERLPSIVVEPTEQSECQREEFNEVEAEEYCSEDQTEASVDGEQRDKDRRMDEGSVNRKSSISPSESQLSLSRLSPPASPTHRETVPPSPRS